MTALTFWSIGTRWLGNATSPIVASTPESASSNGTPTATRAPKTSSNTMIVIGIERSPAVVSWSTNILSSAFDELTAPASPT